MLIKQFLSAFALVVIISSSAAYAQKVANTPPPDPKTTPAYSMLIQKKVKVQAELESLLNEYGSEWPKAKTLQFELDALKVEMKGMAEITEPQVPKLTSGYGTLILRKVSLKTEIQTLSLEWGSDWPAIKDKERELELLNKELQKVMK